ncbi:diacylglycerol kinase family lipid kinase [bacterium]|nr:diacylglycerol kinase family lipid kinase [bacterium]
MGDEATQADQGVVLLNPASGASRGPNNLEELTALAAAHGLRLRPSQRAGDLTRLACEEVRAGCPLIIAAGGDDSVREVLWGMDLAGVFARPGEERPYFGILPLGTFNNFARYLNVPLDPEEALATALTGVLHRVDLGRAGDRLFTESVGVGVDVAAWKAFPKESPSMFRRLWDGAIAVLKAITVFRPRRYFLEVDGRLQSFRAYHITVANSSHFSAGIAIAPHAVIDDGNLDLCVIPSLSKLGFIMAIPIIFLGKHTAYLRGVRYSQVRRVRLWSEHSGALLRIDGRLGPPLPAEIQVIPQALPMRLPV